MEITGIFGQNQQMGLPLNEEQKTALSEIFSKYSPESMTPEDHRAMRQEIKDAGVPMGQETMTMLREAGFKPPARPPMGMGMGLELDGSESTEESKKGQLWDIYQKFQNGEITEAEFLELIQNNMGVGMLMNMSL